MLAYFLTRALFYPIETQKLVGSALDTASLSLQDAKSLKDRLADADKRIRSRYLLTIVIFALTSMLSFVALLLENNPSPGANNNEAWIAVLSLAMLLCLGFALERSTLERES
jgi:hypothetical protein